APAELAPPEPVAPVDGGFTLDPAAAQADINAYMHASKAKKARKTIIYLVIFLIFAGVVGFLMHRSAVKENTRKEAAQFLKSFFEVNNGSLAGFWRCVVWAKQKDIHLMDPAALVEGLDTVFAARPERQGNHVQRKCLPMLAGAMTELDALKTPPDFKERLDALKKQLLPLKTAFEAYVAKMEQAKTLTTHQKEIVKAADAFHSGETTDRVQSVGYVNLLLCAVPELPKMAKSIKKAPDVQPLVDYFRAELKKSLVDFADILRKKCYPQLHTIAEAKSYALIVRKMGGPDDARDAEAIRYTFKKASKGFFKTDLDAIGKGFTDYRNAVVKVSQVADKFKNKE
ncbi:MAG: hypothetical protein KAI47_23720, partial [Deltaproteobacteria bacterium]|nr:hypothetical protein [Deltaproteobacteria bacterium]